MDRHLVRNWATQELALHVAKVVIETLERGGVRALPVKGVLLARQVYDPAHRPIADVDLIVRPSDFNKAVRIARSAGWPLVWDSKGLGNVNFLVEALPTDVACSIGPAGVSAVGAATMIARATRSNAPFGFDHWQIELHDHTLLLAADAFKDKLGRGKPWAREDLVRISGIDGFSAEVLVERATAARLRTMLAIVADWVVKSGPDPVWTLIAERLRSPPLRAGYIQRYARALQAKGSTRNGWYLSAMTRAVSDSPARRALALALGAVGTVRFVARHGSLGVNVWDKKRNQP